MNPVIERLWNQASQESDSWEAQVAFVETFAELIVKECADISDASFHNGSAGYTAILKHFGVEP